MSSARDVLINILTKGDASGSDKVSGSLDQLGKTADRVGKDLSLKVTAPLVALGGLSVKFAADAAEAASKLEAVFGDQTGRINERIAELRDTIPATTAELQGLYSGIQDLLVPLGLAPTEAAEMSDSIVRLAGDLASFNNIPIGEALERIRSGLVGQYEPLLKFGVALNASTVKAKAFEQGIGDGKRELTAAERAQVAYQLILEGTTAAHGDAARTAESAANQFKFLKSETTELATIVGNQLLPAITPMVSGLKDAASAAQDLNPALLDVGIGLAGLAASAGPVLVATAAVLKYRNALKATTIVAGPWLAALGGAAVAYQAISSAAHDARQANDAFRDSIGLGDASFVDAILGANSEEELDRRIGQAQVKLDGLREAIRAQEQQIAEPRGFWESGILHERTKRGLEEELVAMQAQAAALQKAIELGRERGADLVETNQTTQTQVEGVEELTELQRFLNTLTEEEKNLRQETLADADLEIAILDAKIAGNEKLLQSLEDQKRAQIIAQRLEKGGATEEEASRLADEIVRKTRLARDAESERNQKKREGIRLTREETAAEEERARKLREGVRTEEFIGIDGQRGQRFIQNGRVIDESEAFVGPAPVASDLAPASSSPAPTQQPTTPTTQPPPQASADLTPAVEALNAITLNLAPFVAAAEQLQQRLQQQITDNASRIEQLGN